MWRGSFLALAVSLTAVACGGGGGGGSVSGGSGGNGVGAGGSGAVGGTGQPGGTGGAGLQPDYIPPGCTTLVTNPPPPDPPQLGANPTLTTAQQLSRFDDTVTLVNDLYLYYPTFNGNDWPSLATAARARIAAGIDTEAFYVELKALIAGLGDAHSYYRTPAETALESAAIAGTAGFVGVGLLLEPVEAKKIATTLAVFPDSPADHAGLAPHDNIVAIDGTPLYENGVHPTTLLRGVPCSVVLLRIETPGQAARDVAIVRAALTASLPVWTRMAATADGARVGYLFVPTFFQTTITGEIRTALTALGGAGPLDGLIVDNRMNGGGLGSVFLPFVSLFVDGTVGTSISRTVQKPIVAAADPIGNSQTVPLRVLVGTDTVSYGELASGILQDLGRARALGVTSLGNVETLRGHVTADGAQLWLAEERFDPAVSHADWEATGIVPDVSVAGGWETFTFENDPVVAAAVRDLGH